MVSNKRILLAGAAFLTLLGGNAFAQTEASETDGAFDSTAILAEPTSKKPATPPAAKPPTAKPAPALKPADAVKPADMKKPAEMAKDNIDAAKATIDGDVEAAVKAKPDAAKAEVKTDVKTDVKTETKTETKTEEAKPAPIPAAADVKPVDVKPAPEAKPAEAPKKPAAAEKSEDQPRDFSKTVYGVANTNGSFKILLELTEQARLNDMLKSPGAHTLFAPTDAAFEKLPKKTLEDLRKPENADKLNALLTYHVVNGKMEGKNLKGVVSEPNAAQGAVLKIDGTGSVIKVNESVVTKADIEANNGVIHAIDAVLMPPGFTLEPAKKQ